jgi:hypothetical protein
MLDRGDIIDFDYRHCELCAEEAAGEIENFQIAVDDFLAGRYWLTSKCLSANYFMKDDKGAQKSGFSIRIFRKDGKICIEAAGDEGLEEILKKTTATINDNQTDEWFLANLLQMLPKKYKGHVLYETEIADLLV